MSVEVNNESGSVADEKALADLGRFVLDALSIDPLAEVSVLLVDSDTMAALHQQRMDLPDGPSERRDPSAPPGTDANPGETMLGDVVLCPAIAADQATSAGHSTDAELQLLCTHGILHLLGYDHGEAEEEREMFELQARLVTDWARATKRGPIRTPLPGTGGEVRDSAGGRRG
jgi:probable rRNA maturation factor